MPRLAVRFDVNVAVVAVVVEEGEEAAPVRVAEAGGHVFERLPVDEERVLRVGVVDATSLLAGANCLPAVWIEPSSPSCTSYCVPAFSGWYSMRARSKYCTSNPPSVSGLVSG